MVPSRDTTSVSPVPTCDLVVSTEAGLYCPAGDFYIDPWRPVERAVITHAHGDHATHGHRNYLASASGAGVLRARLGAISLQSLAYAETIAVKDARVSLHPAGHVLGSAQVRIEVEGHVCVVSGDYKLEHDSTCASFEPVPCHTFITESTFGLPIYRWRPQSEVFAEINQWWSDNAEQRRPSLLFAYAFGKAQRVLAGVDASIGPIVCHGALAPLSARGTPWMRRLGDHSDAFASGLMRVRGVRRQRAFDRGFVLSDHADWPALLDTIRETGASQVFCTHGHAEALARYVGGGVMRTAWEGEPTGD